MVTGDPAAGPAGAHLEHTDLDALDRLELGEQAPPRPRGRRALAALAPPLISAALVVLAWQLLFWAHVKPDYVFPSPAQVFSALADQWARGNLARAVGTSLWRGALGFLAAVAIGTPLGLLLGRVRLARAALGPLVSGLQSLPSVAWVPAAIIWFGLTPAAIYVVVLLGAVPSVANGMVSGLDLVPPLYLRVGHVLGARGPRLARHVLLPAVLPAYLGGLRQGWAFSWRSLMAAELITLSPQLGLGLGQLLDTGRQTSDIALVFAMVLVILAVGVTVELAVFRPAERRLLVARGLAPGR